mmetsp:Transcript_4495/g.15919  ORF Transcript_4495/g.15919 Transcript_4495/m.15919 type:complete len:201 (+) Transcript_4495:3211-3813(+)
MPNTFKRACDDGSSPPACSSRTATWIASRCDAKSSDDERLFFSPSRELFSLRSPPRSSSAAAKTSGRGLAASASAAVVVVVSSAPARASFSRTSGMYRPAPTPPSVDPSLARVTSTAPWSINAGAAACHVPARRQSSPHVSPPVRSPPLSPPIPPPPSPAPKNLDAICFSDVTSSSSIPNSKHSSSNSASVYVLPSAAKS